MPLGDFIGEAMNILKNSQATVKFASSGWGRCASPKLGLITKPSTGSSTKRAAANHETL